MKDSELFSKLAVELGRNRVAGYAIVISEDLSTPRGVGAKMIMDRRGDITGTIGGGTIEALVMAEMKKMMLEGGKKILEYDLDIKSEKSIGMMCGGKVKVFTEVYGIGATVLLLGGGHVSLAVSKLLDLVGISYEIFDDREEFVNKERFPNAGRLHFGSFEETLNKQTYDSKTYILIATRCHAHDIGCLRIAVKKDIPYIGLLSSKTKLKEVYKIFGKEGVNLEKKTNLYSPCGLATGGDSPEEIALSVVAEISAVKNGKPGHFLRKVDDSI